ncbi:MAG: chromosome partitioning protein [Planctomycetes bacterium RBG_16_64_10]|nr:MAG: chromosome partitioning protein [Planctomycetes bacterium RBG_16_64_10]
MKIIAIANQKGGTAKTTTTAALAVLLARGGTPTHLVDMDPQASLTQAFGLKDETDGLYHALTDRTGLPVKTVSRNLTLTPSTVELGRTETELLSETGREFFLRTSLEKTPLPESSVLLLDCPPSLGVLSVNCLATAGGMIAVIQPGGFELHALAHLHFTVQAIRERVNPDLHILGAIITNAHRRRKITEQVRLEVGRVYPLLGTIRADARLLYATTAGAIQHLTRSKALDDYAAVVDELCPVLP